MRSISINKDEIKFGAMGSLSLWNFEILKPRNFETKKPRNLKNKNRKIKNRKPRNQEAKKPRNQETNELFQMRESPAPLNIRPKDI